MLTGWSRNMTLALEFQLYGFGLTLRSSSMAAGPSSRNKPVREEQPGPPLIQRTTGSFWGSLRDSKNPGWNVSGLGSTSTWEPRTIEQMLVVGCIVKITAVLLDMRIDAQRAWVNLLGAQCKVFQLPFNLSFLLAVGILNPDILNIGALGDVMPVGVRSASMLLGGREEAGPFHLMREHLSDLIPDRASLSSQRPEGILETVQGLCPNFRGLLWWLKDMLEWRRPC